MRLDEAKKALKEAGEPAVQKTHFELEMERIDNMEKAIQSNSSLTSDQKSQSLSAIAGDRQKLKAEHRKDLFNAAIKHNRPLFEAVRKFASGQGIEPTWATPEGLQSILEMHKEIVAKATDKSFSQCFKDIEISLRQIKAYRDEVKTMFEAAEKARLDAMDLQVRNTEKVRLVEADLFECAEDAFNIDPRYVVLQMPDIAARLMGEALPQEQQKPQTSQPPANNAQTSTQTIGAVNQQSIAGILIPTRRALKAEDNPHHKAMIDALTMDNVKKAVDSGAKSNSNIEVLAWIGKNIVHLNEVVIDQGLNSKVSLIRQALNYPKG